MTRNLGEAELLNRNSSNLLILARTPISALQYAPDEIGDLLLTLNETLERSERGIDDLGNLLPVVEKHANQTTEQLQELESFLTETHYISEDALKAANAYKDILQTVQSAREAAETADKEAIVVVNSLGEIGETMYDADQNSSTTLNKAHQLHSSTKDDLLPLLENAKEKYIPVESLHKENQNKLDDLEKTLQNVATISFDEIYKNASGDADYASARIKEVGSDTEKYLAELNEKKQEAQSLPKELDQTIRNIQQSEKQLNTINDKLPMLIDTINSLPEKQKKLQLITENIRQNINKLNQQVAFARDLANRIDVGVTFYPNTTLELRNPPALDSFTTSNRISGYFKTSKKDGLIFYVGNPVGTKLRRTKTDDYMALVIQNGYPVLKLDLGNGDEQVINNKYVADDKWYQFIIVRTGNNAKLSIMEQDDDGREIEHTKEVILEGPLSIFNLDRNKSKLFVGGIPVNYDIQNAIEVNSFDGEMEQLVIGDNPVSLWNFNNGYENNHGAVRRDKLLNVHPATGFRFNGNGYAVFNARSYNLRHRSDIQLKFKTFAPEGLLFLAEKDNTFISLELRNGKILYQYNLGHTTKLWHTSKTYNDGQWHTVSATREGPRGQLTVDSENVSDRTKSIEGNVLAAIDVISFGGYPGKHSHADVTNVKFDGCIDSAIVTGNSIDFKQNIKSFDITPGCPDKVAKLVSFVKSRPGYIRHTPLSVSNNFRMNLNFKSKETEGLIFYATNQQQSDGISLALKDGHLVLISQKIEHISKEFFNDSDWHVISIMHTNQELRIDFDDFNFIVTDSPPTPLHILYGNLFIGGLPSTLTAASGMVGSTEPFVGCIADVTLNGNVINFANSTDKKNEILGKCALDIVHWEENPDVHNVPVLPPLIDFDRDTTISPDQFTESHHAMSTTIRGDGGYEEPVVPIEPIESIGGTNRPETLAPLTEEPIQTIEPETHKADETFTRRPPGTAPPRTTVAPKQGCALPLNPNAEDSSLDPNSFRFGTQADGRLEYNSPRGRFKKMCDYYLEFKTGEQNGIIFYVSDKSPTHDAYMALFLRDGHLIFTFTNGSGAAIIQSPGVYNNDLWHKVDFSRDGSNGKLIIDGDSVNFGQAVNADKMELKSPFYIGGLEPADYNNVYSNLNMTESFKGCIRNFLMNGRPMISPRKSGVVPCSDNVESGTFFYGSKSSYVKLKDKFHVGQTFNVKLDIKPRLDSGILISVHGRKDYFILEMVNGSMKLTAENGLGPITAIFEPKTPYYFCDGNWHNIQAVKSKNVVTLSVDNIFTDPKLGDHRAISTTTGGTLFLGGHRFLSNVKRLRGLSSNQAYVGCIKNVHLNNEFVPITPEMAHGNVIVGSCRTN
ncbi:hypothetical protein HHI36_020047 [Cryptolaemus montrouzieri]|uniref:Laminin G domain-containing protein n=1 Tax=Cryptolaemus montrouzieri TaxID=559131 RepID=A0ABD2N9S6_9CUCU